MINVLPLIKCIPVLVAGHVTILFKVACSLCISTRHKFNLKKLEPTRQTIFKHACHGSVRSKTYCSFIVAKSCVFIASGIDIARGINH